MRGSGLRENKLLIMANYLIRNQILAAVQQNGCKSEVEKKERRRIIKDSEKEFFRNKQGKNSYSQIIMPLLQQIPPRI